MKIGINGSGQLAHPNLDAIVADVEKSEADGYASYWLAQTALADSLAMLAIAGRTTSTIELGTAVVPTWTRHPEVMAAGALTAQARPAVSSIGVCSAIRNRTGRFFCWRSSRWRCRRRR